MRKFTATEQDLLRRLLGIAQGGLLPLEKILTHVFFSEAHGRALILQPAGRYGCFYLRPDRFADASVRATEMTALAELMMLLAWLRREGYVLARSAPAPFEAAMHFVGDIFGNIRPSPQYLVLNDRGDYTADPQTIHDRNGEVIYESIRFEGDLFDLALRMSGGSAQVSTTIENLLPPPPAAVPVPPAPQQASAGAPRTVVVPIPKTADAQATRESEKPKERKEGKKGLAKVGDWLLRPRSGVWLLITLAAFLGVLAFQHSASLKRLFAPSQATGALTAVAGQLEPVRPADSSALSVLPSPTPAPTAQHSESVSPGSAVGLYQGLDLSKWNGDWLEHLQGPLKGIRFAFARATYGRAKDHSFDRHWQALRQHGIVRGSYHFYLVHDDPVEQARHYLGVIGSLSPQDIAPVVDFEALSFPSPSTRMPVPDRLKVQADLLVMLDYLERATGRLPLIYTDVATGNQWLDDERFARFPLWIADWSNRKSPRLPAAWKNKGYRFWQRTANYYLPEAGRQALDLDLFRGRLEDLSR